MAATADLEFWKAKLSTHYNLLEKAVQKRFRSDPENAEEALSYVSEKLLEDDMRRLRLYDPSRGAKFTTYLSVLAQRLISRFLEQKRGRFRFPKWLADQKNALWLMVYELMCKERRPETDVVETVKDSAIKNRDETVIQEAIWVVHKKYPNCGKQKEKEVSTGDENDYSKESEPHSSSFHHLNPEEQVVLGQRILISESILAESEEDISWDAGSENLMGFKKRLSREFKATPVKRLFLRMIYQDGMSVSAAGRQLGWNANQASGQHRRIMTQLREIIGENISI